MTDILPQSSVPPVQKLSSGMMFGWSYYFVLKLLLYWRGSIDFYPLENLTFFVLLAIPLPLEWRRLRLVLAVPVALILLYHDSFFPPLSRVFSQAGVMAGFSFSYLVELIGRVVNWQIVFLLAAAMLLMFLARAFVRIGTIILLVMIALTANQLFGILRSPFSIFDREIAATSTPPVATVNGAGAMGTATPLTGGASNAELSRVLNKFYASEARRMVRLPKPGAAELPFDLLFIHVCSLSWDDMEAAGLQQHPLWKSFDIVFRHFNSAATYSGPAAVRVNRATCGQSSNDALYAPAAQHCYLMPSLKEAGFDINFAMNHDGHFDDFLPLVRAQGLQAAPLPLDGLQVTMKGFDDSPIRDDGAVLTRWRALRATSEAPRTALYYNSITLHDGNRLSGQGSINNLQSYKLRLTKLFDEMEGLMQSLATGSRRTVVVLIPEHGAAVRGDRLQIAGLREIPTPSITTVPVGIKIIDPAVTAEHDTQYVDSSTSFLALSQVIANMLEKSPFGPTSFDPKLYVQDLPTTEFVAENQAIVMRVAKRYFWREDKESWRPFPDDLVR